MSGAYQQQFGALGPIDGQYNLIPGERQVMAEAMGQPVNESDPYLNPRSLAEYRQMFSVFQSAVQDERMRNLEDLDYYHGQQFTREELAELIKRKQPIVPVNRIRTAVNGIVGVYTRGNSDVRCYPRGPQDADSSDVATDVLRYIGEASRLKNLKKGCFKNFLVEGSCAALITVDNDFNVKPVKIRWEELFWDPRSREEDFSDARYMGIAKWVYQDDAAKMYPKFATELLGYQGDGVGVASIINDAGQDRPLLLSGWVDATRKRILIVEVYHQVFREWHRCCYYGGGILSEGLSPYLDEKGRPSNPIEAHTAYVDRQNNRYGVVRDMKPIQDEINKRRSKLLHLLTSSQVQAEDPGAIETDTEVVRAEAAKPDGVIPFGWRKVPTTDMSGGQMQLLQESKNELERMSPNPAILGRQGADSSGRALLARQQAGLVELDDILSGFDDWELRVWRQCWARAKQYWTEPMWVRIEEDADTPKFVGINQPMGQPTPDAANDGEQARDPNTNEPQHDPVQPGASPFGYRNQISTMDVDIIVRTEPETASLMMEVVKDLKDIVSSNPNYADQVPFEVFIELSPIPRKRQILQMIAKAKEASSQAAQQDQAFKKAVEHAVAQAKVDEAQSKVILNEATALEALSVVNKNGLGAFGDALNTIHEITLAETAPSPGSTGGSSDQQAA